MIFPRVSRRIWKALGSIATFLAFLLAIWLIPKYQVSSISGLTSAARFDAENASRTTVAQILGGLLVLAGAYFAWQQLQESESSRKLTESGQITERFTRAVDQLGSDKLEIRLGGIYALERIAFDSERDHWPVMEVLTAFVREYSSSAVWSEKPRADIQAVLTVLGRRRLTYQRGEDKPLNLKQTYLRGADLNGSHLEGAFLYEANLEGAILHDSFLCRATLNNATLVGAELLSADLRHATFWRANFRGAKLTNADITGADFGGALAAAMPNIDPYEEEAKNLTLHQIEGTKGHLDPSTKLPTKIRTQLKNRQGAGTLGSVEDALASLAGESTEAS